MSLISRFISKQRKILFRRMNRLTLKQQLITIAIKQTRILSPLSYWENGLRVFGVLWGLRATSGRRKWGRTLTRI